MKQAAAFLGTFVLTKAKDILTSLTVDDAAKMVKSLAKDYAKDKLFDFLEDKLKKFFEGRLEDQGEISEIVNLMNQTPLSEILKNIGSQTTSIIQPSLQAAIKAVSESSSADLVVDAAQRVGMADVLLFANMAAFGILFSRALNNMRLQGDAAGGDEAAAGGDEAAAVDGAQEGNLAQE